MVVAAATIQVPGESGNAPGQSLLQNQLNTMETDNANSLPSEQVEEIPDSMEAIVHENVEVLGDEGITIFSMGSIK